MTKIVASHRLAQKAVLAVSTILNNAGALTETVANDYGEDLLVQTQNADAADPFHILIQVKGTTLKLGKDGARAFQFEIAHLRRWIGHIQPVLVCVFDDLTGSIFAFYPRNQFSLWALATTSKRRMTVRLTDEMKFNSSTALVFIWQCRIEYFDRMLSWYDSRAQDAYLAPIPSRAKKRLMDESNLLVLNFVKSIGIFDNNDTFSDSFREMVENCSRNFAVDNLNVGTRSLGMEEVVMLCLMGSVHELTGDGLRIGLANRASTLAAHFFKTFHPGEWHAAHEVLKRKVQIRAK